MKGRETLNILRRNKPHVGAARSVFKQDRNVGQSSGNVCDETQVMQ